MKELAHLRPKEEFNIICPYCLETQGDKDSNDDRFIENHIEFEYRHCNACGKEFYVEICQPIMYMNRPLREFV